jgi:hypothetical protein
MFSMLDYTEAQRVIRCMYFILTTISTVGYGDYFPVSNIERVYVIFVQLFGVAFYSYVMGNFIDIINSYDKKMGIVDKGSELQNWLSLLARFTGGKPIDETIVGEIEEEFQYFWDEYKLESVSKDNQYLVSLPKYNRYHVKIRLYLTEIRSLYHICSVTCSTISSSSFGWIKTLYPNSNMIWLSDLCQENSKREQ